MNRSVSSKILLILTGLAASACGLLGLGGGKGGDAGELVGVPGREGWVLTVPYGMVPIPAGTFHMGQADEDPASTQINYNKQVTIGSFFMDDTEITNNEYRQFTNFYLIDNGSIEGFETIDAETFRQRYSSRDYWGNALETVLCRLEFAALTKHLKTRLPATPSS